MIKLTWINWNCESDSAELTTIDDARRFIEEYIIEQPISIDSLRVTDGAKEYSCRVTTSGNHNDATVVTWLDHNGEPDEQTLKNSTDAMQFIEEYLLGQPTVLNSIKLGEQSLSLVI